MSPDARPRDTFDDVLEADDRGKLLKWLGKRPFVRTWKDVVLVHAGLDPTWDDPREELDGLDPLEPHPASDFATRGRYCDPEGGRPASDWPPPSKPHAAWYEHWMGSRKESRTLVFGHWARRGLTNSRHALGLDTGCVYGGKLTAWIAEEDRIVQVKGLPTP